jgi:hypothetical protein
MWVFDYCDASLMLGHCLWMFAMTLLSNSILCLVCMKFFATVDHWYPTLMSRNPCGDVMVSLFNVFLTSGVGNFFFWEVILHQISFDWDQTKCSGEKQISQCLSHFVFTKERQTSLNKINLVMYIFVMIRCFQELHFKYEECIIHFVTLLRQLLSFLFNTFYCNK